MEIVVSSLQFHSNPGNGFWLIKGPNMNMFIVIFLVLSKVQSFWQAAFVGWYSGSVCCKFQANRFTGSGVMSDFLSYIISGRCATLIVLLKTFISLHLPVSSCPFAVSSCFYSVCSLLLLVSLRYIAIPLAFLYWRPLLLIILL